MTDKEIDEIVDKMVIVDDYETILAKAIEAANKAGDEWMAKALARGPMYNVLDGNRVVGQLLDVCGMAWCKCTDKRSAFYRWGNKEKNWENGFVDIPHKYCQRQEMGLAEACIRAAVKSLKENGVEKVMMASFID